MLAFDRICAAIKEKYNFVPNIEHSADGSIQFEMDGKTWTLYLNDEKETVTFRLLFRPTGAEGARRKKHGYDPYVIRRTVVITADKASLSCTYYTSRRARQEDIYLFETVEQLLAQVHATVNEAKF